MVMHQTLQMNITGTKNVIFREKEKYASEEQEK